MCIRDRYRAVSQDVNDKEEYFALNSGKLVNGETISARLSQALQLKKTLEATENIVKIYRNYFDDSDGITVVMEAHKIGDDLSSFVSTSKPSEEVSKAIMRDIINGVAALHDTKLIHRDLRPDAIQRIKGKWKIGYYFLSKVMEGNVFANKSFQGTTKYMSPELLKLERLGPGAGISYSEKTDIWSLGALHYFMLYGKPPAIPGDAKTPVQFLETPTVSEACKNFISSMLQYDEKKRPTAKSLLEHPYLNEQLPSSVSSASTSMHGSRSFERSTGPTCAWCVNILTVEIGRIDFAQDVHNTCIDKEILGNLVDNDFYLKLDYYLSASICSRVLKILEDVDKDKRKDYEVLPTDGCPEMKKHVGECRDLKRAIDVLRYHRNLCSQRIERRKKRLEKRGIRDPVVDALADHQAINKMHNDLLVEDCLRKYGKEKRPVPSREELLKLYKIWMLSRGYDAVISVVADDQHKKDFDDFYQRLEDKTIPEMKKELQKYVKFT
eukprot:TRINITY_DN8422_c0_g1_i3.p1 TRINITY_DN8422_c0_g1~~TRINITY_DN8422_c0_g1_i3.p1  ORF type:complete len:524 (+),score=95.67 TRINITY_DN8422_c0_g1_i3:86-1573(+)